MLKLLKGLAWLLISLVVLFSILILTGIITNYDPDKVISLERSDEPAALALSIDYNLLIWNIGYCGLDASMDFFYDGGKQVRPPESNVKENLNAVMDFISGNDTTDFYLLQEVDINSRRSYKINQYDSIHNMMIDYYSYPGINYKVFFVPIPVFDPLGKVKSGLQALSRFQPSSVARYGFPGNYAFPKNLFMLDRCFLVCRYPTKNGRELLVINTHNSAYDDGTLRQMQMAYLRKFLLDEYEKGNYIIVGGDWNQSPPGSPDYFKGHVFDDKNYSEIPADFLPGNWKWAWDRSVPTNRRVGTTYIRGNTPVTLIDFYLVSPNVRIINVKAFDLDFQHSDHQPVALKVQLGDN